MVITVCKRNIVFYWGILNIFLLGKDLKAIYTLLDWVKTENSEDITASSVSVKSHGWD